MSVKQVIISFISVLFVLFAEGQTCTTNGQTPETAFPVCGTTTFQQSNVPICSSNSLYVPGCSGPGSADYENKNPFWYKFTCYVSGTLGFLITPNNLEDDYDWQLYDVTGLDPDQVYTNENIIVSGNWAGNPGTTGATPGGVNFIQCASPYDGTQSRYAAMPMLIAGHQYILLVSHFTDSQSGYGLSFGGGTASITDTTKPALKAVSYSCDATKLYINLNKSMTCSSLAPNGSDFTISSGASVISASSYCSGFDMDSLVLELSNPLPPGNYKIIMRDGTDSNTLIDNCGNQIPVGDFLPLSILPLAPTPLDSLTALKCAPQSLQLVLNKNILCSSVASDGSDFVVTGPSPVTVVSAATNCVNNLSKTITVNLSAPIVIGGIYQIILKSGSDGNTIIDECAQETPAGSAINFSIKDTVSANFTFNIVKGCSKDVVQFFHDGSNGVNQWLWQLDYNGTSTLQNPVTSFDPFGQKKIILAVSNGFCSDTSSQIIDLGVQLKAAFQTDSMICPEDSATFLNQSSGNIISYYWDFKNGSISTDQNPLPQKYPITLMENNYSVLLVVENALGCYDTAVHNITVLKSCYIAVPNAFTPNGDGLNDYFYPLNAFKAENLEFKVYNRLGQLVFETNDWTKKWDGTINGHPQDAGVYVWTLKYTVRQTGKTVFTKGSAVLIR